MSREARVRGLLTRYGDKAVWNGQTFGVHLWPVTEEAGPNKLYHCVAPASFLPYLGDTVECLGKTYTVYKVEGEILEGERLYTTAILALCDEWGR